MNQILDQIDEFLDSQKEQAKLLFFMPVLLFGFLSYYSLYPITDEMRETSLNTYKNLTNDLQKTKSKNQSLINSNLRITNSIKKQKKELALLEKDKKELDFLDEFGNMPIPPYIKKNLGREAFTDEHKKYYQTVYANNGEAIAAPTAGLHFTSRLINKLQDLKFNIRYITLNISYATFKKVEEFDIRKHKIHKESFYISEEVARDINEFREDGYQIIAVGTTTLRALESAFFDKEILSGKFDTSLFIYPGYKFNVVDALITNFHLPCSSLLMLVSAFADRQFIMESYKKAIEKRYRFFSYGDAMLII